MKFISHRGNVNGIEIEKENTLKQIILVINRDFDVEIDLWFYNDNFYLGHDNPQIHISLSFLLENSNVLWCHAKNIVTLNELLKYPEINCFFHQNDDCTLTSHNYIWTFPEKQLTNRSILLKFEKDLNYEISKNISGICSDNIEYYKNKFI